MFELVGMIITGIGLFLAGVRIVSNNMKNMTSRKLRLMIARLTKSKFKSALWGIITGGISQSGTSSVFLLISMVSGGLLTAQNALLILTWVEVGTAILVFIATVQMKVAVLYLLAVSGFLFSLDRKGKWKLLFGCLFGISLLLYGFDLIKSSSVFLAQSVWVQKLMEQAEASFFLPFLFGMVLRFITQSSSTVSILAMPMAFAGLLTLPQCLMMVYGTSAGSGLATIFLSMDIKGTPKQVSLFKTVFDTIGAFVMVSLFYIEHYYNLPLVSYIISSITSSVKEQIAFGFLATKLVPTIITIVFLKPIWNLIVKISPASVEESLSKPKFLNDGALDDPETAMDLVKSEDLRIILRLPNYFNSIRQEEAGSNINIDTYHSAGLALSKETDTYITEIYQQAIAHDTAERLLEVQNEHHKLQSLEETVFKFVIHIKNCNTDENMKRLVHNLTEGLHTILVTFAEYSESVSDDDKEILCAMTDDRRSLMERIRKEFYNNSTDQDQTGALLQITDYYQRAVWLINQLIVK